MRYPLPYAYAKAQQVLLEVGADESVLWAAPDCAW